MAKALRSKGTNALVWVLIGLLVLGLAGFGIGNFTGTVDSVGSVGDEEIPVNDYAVALQNELGAYSAQANRNVPLSEGLELGVGRMALQRLVLEAALDNEASRIGLSAGDQHVLEQLRQTPEFQGLDGEFDESQYEFMLERSGRTPGEYDEVVREESARALLQAAVAGAIPPSESYVDRLISHYFEGRDITWARLDAASLGWPDPVPTESDLRSHYTGNPESFMLPEAREITFAWLTPEMLAESIDVDEAALRRLYEERSEEFNVPERRLVERMVFSTMDEALAAKSRLEAGELDFAGLASERGLSLSDLDLGEVRRGDLGGAADDVVFGLQETGETDPVDTGLGPAIFSVNAILLARTVSFEAAEADLHVEAALERARRSVAEMSSGIDDLLAAGAGLEELAAETAMRLGRVSFNELSEHDIVGYAAFREEAALVDEADYPELKELADGGVFALRLDGITESAPRPFDEVREDVSNSWRRAEIRSRLLEFAEEAETGLRSGREFDELGLEPVDLANVGRSEFIEGAPAGLVAEAFELEPGGVAVIEDAESMAVVRVNAIVPADPESVEASTTSEILRLQSAAAAGQDAFVIFVVQVQEQAGILIDQAIIDAVHAQFQ